jgi:hypothetical protein
MRDDLTTLNRPDLSNESEPPWSGPGIPAERRYEPLSAVLCILVLLCLVLTAVVWWRLLR